MQAEANQVRDKGRASELGCRVGMARAERTAWAWSARMREIGHG